LLELDATIFVGGSMHSINFFGINTTTFVTQLSVAPGDLLGRVEARLRADKRVGEDGIRRTLKRVADISRNELPEDCDVNYFDALCWLLEVAGEKITIGSFEGFRRIAYLKEVGIWPWLLRSKPRFPVPVCPHPPPEVGFLPFEDIGRIALPGFERLPSTDSADVRYARQEFQEVLESLAEEKLDLLAVVI
jgi:hypothetical protein